MEGKDSKWPKAGGPIVAILPCGPLQPALPAEQLTPLTRAVYAAASPAVLPLMAWTRESSILAH